ncbi:MAG: hypothetical protein Q9196_007202, partial [Gyalolechia fulgens]
KPPNPDSFPTTQLFILGMSGLHRGRILLTLPPSDMPPRRTGRPRIMVGPPAIGNPITDLD